MKRSSIFLNQKDSTESKTDKCIQLKKNSLCQYSYETCLVNNLSMYLIFFMPNIEIYFIKS